MDARQPAAESPSFRPPTTRFPMLRPLLLAVLVTLPVGAAAQSVCTNGTATLGATSYACDRIDLLAVLPVGTDGPFRSGGLNDIWGWTDPENGAEYALVGTRSGTVFVDVTSPTEPRVLGKLGSTNQTNSTWRDIKVYADHAFVGSEAPGHGIQVFDLTRLRGLTSDSDRDFQPDARYTGVGRSHNVVINEETGFLYAVGAVSVGALPAACNAKGFHAVDVSDPKNPTFSACFNDEAQETGLRSPGYTHDAQCVVYTGPDADYTDREICFASNEDVVSIFDVEDKRNVTLITQVAYPNEAYTHQGWLTKDQRYFLANDELDEVATAQGGGAPNQRTLVFDVSDLDNPDFAFQYDSGLNTIDHNLYTVGQYVYQANYESGLRIVDLSRIADEALTEVAFFDTYPQSTTAQFNGMWSVYPYFTSGVVVASDSDNGLFVLQPPLEFTTGIVACDGCNRPDVSLSAPYPNPATGQAALQLRVVADQQVTARLYDVAGRELATLYAGPVGSANPVDLEVDGRDLPVGVYVVRVTGETFTASQRLTIAR